MFVQWWVKGIRGDEDPRLAGISEPGAAAIVDDGTGILCKWWQKTPLLQQLRRRLLDPPAPERRGGAALADPVTPAA